MKRLLPALCLCISLLAACNQKKPDPTKAYTVTSAVNDTVKLPPPYATKPTTVYCKIVPWPKDTLPKAPAGFKVSLYASGLANPRNIYVAPNHDVFVSQANTEIKGIKKLGARLIGVTRSEYLGPSANNIILFRDSKGKPQNMGVFLKGVNQPYGMLILGNWFYVAATDALWRFPYHTGQTRITDNGIKLLTLPAGGYNNHWTRNIIASPDGNNIFISVGSGSNDGEHGMKNEIRRADILEVNPYGTGEEIYGYGLRNPAGIAINPVIKQLWTAVNERDNLGDNLVPDYLTSVKVGGFYGWPFAYYGQHEDPNHKGERPQMVKKTIVPDVSLGAHTASLGLAFYTGTTFPQRYINGAFIGQHGSWNSSKLVGYKVAFVPFVNGKATGKPEDFLTGFIANEQKHEVYGRPVGVAVAADGALLVADDAGNKIWRVSVSH